MDVSHTILLSSIFMVVELNQRLNGLVKVTQEICDRVKNFLKANLLFSIIVFLILLLAVFKVEVNPILRIPLCICSCSLREDLQTFLQRASPRRERRQRAGERTY